MAAVLEESSYLINIETEVKEKDLVIEQSRELVDELYKFRDCYYQDKEITSETSSQKTNDVQIKLNETVDQLNKFIWTRQDKSFYHLYMGKALNVVANFDPQCEENLTKAIKLNPKLSEAWFQLGESHWKNSDVDSAYNCFKSALEHQTDKQILRSISMVLRQLKVSPEQRKNNLSESIAKAKEALKLDMKDGKSWAVLGSGYLNSFFANPFNSKYMNHTLSAYQKAVKDPIANCDPDLHYNYGIALLYETKFSECLDQWIIASNLDYAWKFPKESIGQMISFVDTLLLSMENKGKIKEKRFRQLLSALKDPKSRMKDLGPYVDGKLGNTIEMKRTNISELKEGGNNNTMVLVKVICGVLQGDSLSFTIIVADETGTMIPVRLFNLAQGKGPIVGDSVVIPEPFVEEIEISSKAFDCAVTELTKNQNIFPFDHKFATNVRDTGINQLIIRVSIPSILVVNGRKVNDKWTALPVVQNIYFTDNWLSSLN